MRPWALLVLAVVGCTGGKPLSRLPSQVVASEPATVLGVQCLGSAKGTPRLCAVLLRDVEKVASTPSAGAASLTIHGSTTSTTLWFSEPQPAPARTFTLISPNDSRTVVSARRVLFYARHAEHGGPPVSEGAEQGTVGYVVDDYGSWAIDGAHSDARYFPATSYSDVAGKVAEHPSLTPPADSAWQRMAPQARRILRAEFRDHFTGGYRVDGFVSARIEASSAGEGRWVSFAYFAGGEQRGEYPCPGGGPPRGILVVAGRAQWAFPV